MPGTLLHSVDDVIRRMLVQLGLVADPDVSPLGSWPGYTADEPSSPDNVVTVYGTTGRDFGRIMIDGERPEHEGFQVRVRAVDHPTGFRKARALAVALDTLVYRQQVSGGTLSPNVYCVHSISRTSNVIPLGKETPKSRRKLFTINATTYILMLS